MYALLLAIIYLSFISLGLPDSLIGAAWPVMHQDLGLPVSAAGIVTMIIAFGTIISSLMSDRLTKLMGTGVVTAVSVGMTAGALLGFSFSGSLWMLCLWAIPYGLGAGAVDAALNNYVALHYSSRQMSWLHGCWGIGASISPFIMGIALSHNMGWPAGYQIVGAIQVAVTVILIAAIPLWQKIHPSPTTEKASVQGDTADASSDETSAGSVSLLGALRIRGVPLMLIAFFGYCALEGTAILWGATYLSGERGVAPATAASYASLYLIGITVGRFLGGTIANRVGDRGMIRYGTLVMIAGILLIALPLPGEYPALAGLVIAGLGSAPIYPAIIHATPVNFGRANSQEIIGIQMAAAYTGTTLMPPLFGFISSATGLWLFPYYMLLLAGLIIVMTQALNRVLTKSAAQS